MFFILSKVLVFVTYPLCWIIALILCAFLFKKKKVYRPLLVTASGIFILFSNTFILNEVFKRWEGVNEPDGGQHFDAVVVLGGFSSYNTLHDVVTFNENSDRIIRALMFYKLGRTDKLVISGGSGLLLKPEEKESVFVRPMLLELGVADEDLLVEGNSRNTHENAVETSKLLEREFGSDGSFLLITSAFHMRRAKACFEKTGLQFTYYRVGFVTDDDDYNLATYILPSAMSLETWQVLFKEWLGYFVYWIRDYV